ncbi:MAG: GMC family oxidoreductase [Bryobacterales bacterium]
MAGIIAGRDVDKDLTGSRTLRPDFCIIGSGAGGGACALKLAEAGFDTVVLEEGPDIPLKKGHGGDCHTRATLKERESLMYRLLYQEGAGRLTSDSSTLILQGRCLGGGTAVNWSACLPPPDATLLRWKQDYGLPFTPDNLRPYIQEVVNYLNIDSNTRYNTSACRMIRGCKQLGYPYSNLPNNTKDCRECGSCGTGCPYDRKQSGFVKWIPDAAGLSAAPAQPATVYTDTHVWDLIVQNRKVRRVVGRFLDGTTKRTGKKIHVEPKLGVIFAAGAVGTPSILLRAQSFAEVRPEPLQLSAQLGKRTHIHPVTICFGLYGPETHSAYGVPDNMMTDKFAAGPTGYLIETGSSFPVMTAILSLEFGADLVGFMKEYFPRQTVLYAHHTSGFDRGKPYGQVRVVGTDFRPEFEYKLDINNEGPMRESLKEMTKIHLAAGAEEVYHVTNPAIRIRSTSELGKLDSVDFKAGKTSMLTVHVMGGCAMGSDPNESVVDTDFRLRGLDNAWVVDGSLFPTGLGANPQVTIYALALRGAEKICEQNGRAAQFKLNHQGLRWPWDPSPPGDGPCLV